uniref:hypothetical protein n=1 Tax=Lachnoclostridium phocaeense TaxID=1871021 RepID=UPI0026DBF262|nr:hypothetical protein [Lachnoclostridium phocaeense]
MNNKVKWLVTYWEAYSSGYIVEADEDLTKEEVEEMVKQDIFDGRRNGPDNCYDSGCKAERLA